MINKTYYKISGFLSLKEVSVQQKEVHIYNKHVLINFE